MENQVGILTTILSAAGGAFFAWLLIRIVTYFVIRKRLLNYIKTVINVYLKQVHNNNDWLIRFTEDCIRENSIIEGAPFYTKEQFQNLTKINIEHLFYLKNKEQVHITGLITNMIEFEILMEGFCKSANELQTAGTSLSKDKAEFMTKRSQRIQSLVHLFPEKIRKLTDLNEVYNKKTKAVELIIKREL